MAAARGAKNGARTQQRADAAGTHNKARDKLATPRKRSGPNSKRSTSHKTTSAKPAAVREGGSNARRSSADSLQQRSIRGNDSWRRQGIARLHRLNICKTANWLFLFSVLGFAWNVAQAMT